MKTFASLLFWLAVAITFFLWASHHSPALRDVDMASTVANDIGLIVIWEWMERNLGRRWRGEKK